MKEKELAQSIYDILADVYGQSPWTLAQVQADLAQDNTDYFYAYEGHEIVGFLSIQNLVGQLEITNLAVKKAYQGQGLASRLLQKLEGRSEDIFLEVRASNQSAKRLYEKFNFSCLAKRKAYYHNPIEDALIMQRAAKK
ncbi:ribosomal protein S18-alanine N-acetyltransferase [Streptococcus tangpeifui]|uniref:[Ribosomal protein bS18]-alanine N-acetyltransferase n=1 Tax=Streptococcus criceti HS-6 TaxID=873449 RepID=G5JRB6_STRCG|nr:MULTISPECIES: ribosomal protein S18-alanine N-acetyltransferase [Streptococcus]EHI74655.1 ribosomal-protein-alanine acetyltransferase [Streptococcus criceti HS-6]SUN43762.1 ribosomal-protein-alanine acetyltransferase [Streptococcus criceti]